MTQAEAEAAVAGAQARYDAAAVACDAYRGRYDSPRFTDLVDQRIKALLQLDAARRRLASLGGADGSGGAAAQADGAHGG